MLDVVDHFLAEVELCGHQGAILAADVLGSWLIRSVNDCFHQQVKAVAAIMFVVASIGCAQDGVGNLFAKNGGDPHCSALLGAQDHKDTYMLSSRLILGISVQHNVQLDSELGG